MTFRSHVAVLCFFGFVCKMGIIPGPSYLSGLGRGPGDLMQVESSEGAGHGPSRVSAPTSVITCVRCFELPGHLSHTVLGTTIPDPSVVGVHGKPELDGQASSLQTRGTD